MTRRRTPAVEVCTRLALVLVVATGIAGCMTPRERFDMRLHAAGLMPEIAHGTRFDHLLVRKPGRSDDALHVYIEGDGTPWVSIAQPSVDPTPRNPLAFDLMLRDSNDSIYVGRPCYFDVVSRGCDARYWTHLRYSEAVVDSMAKVIDGVRGSDDSRPVVLIGYSGGGVLAVLLEHRLKNVVAIVTIAANLDVAGWVSLHGYSALAGSLDPARLARDDRRAAIPEHHYVGSDDRVVPPWIVRAYARDRADVTITEWPRFDHVCCWAAVWQDILASLPRQ